MHRIKTAIAAVLLGPPAGSAVPPPQVDVPPITRPCKDNLTGPDLVLGTWRAGFGQAEHQASLPLGPRQYILTIDDGPSPATTGALLRILERHCVHATFFMVGRRAAASPALARRIVLGGHGFGSHSQTHGNFAALDDSGLRREILGGAASVETAALGRRLPPGAIRMFRIPGGPGVPLVPLPEWMALLRANRFILAGRDASPEDWRNQAPEISLHRLLAKLPDRGVILLHDGQSNTPRLLELLLAELSRRGAKIVALHTKT